MKIGTILALGVFALSLASGCASIGSRRPAQVAAPTQDPVSLNANEAIGALLQHDDFFDDNHPIKFRLYGPIGSAAGPYTMTMEGYGKKIVAISTQNYPAIDPYDGWSSANLTAKMSHMSPPQGLSTGEVAHIRGAATEDLKSFSTGDLDEASAILSMLGVLGAR